MAFWIKSGSKEKSEQEREAESGGLLKKKAKDEKKELAKPKRIDNLRIPQQLHISLQSLGTSNEYIFQTKDLSATGAFVICHEVKAYPFQTTSTILEARIELKHHTEEPQEQIQFLAKIARIVEFVEEDALPQSKTPGFGIRIVMIGDDDRRTLESFIARHGQVDPAAPVLDLAPDGADSEDPAVPDVG